MESTVENNINSASEEQQPSSSVEFGAYLSNAYELLERTLSLLNINDLFNASLVCKSWNQAVRHVLRKREKGIRLRWFVHFYKACNSVHRFENGNYINFRSQFVLGFQKRRQKQLLESELMVPRCRVENCAEQKPSDDGKREVSSDKRIPGLFGDCFAVESETLMIPVYTDKNDLKLLKSGATSIFFPQMEGCNINSLTVNHSSDLNIIKQSLLSDAKGPLKGILVFTFYNGTDEVDDMERPLFENILECNELSPFALAGGIFRKIKQFGGNGEIKKHNFLLIRFCGDNVNCFSAVLAEQGERLIESFMKKMKNDLEEIDSKKQQRIAFIIRCVGREEADLENRLFYKYFPNIPAFISDSYGEYGYPINTKIHEDVKKRKLSEIQAMHSYCTVFFFITVQLPS